MTRIRLPLDRSETGASLILALAMVTLISVALVAALGFSTASLRTVTVIRSQRVTAYSVDGAMETAVQTMRYNATAGTTAVGTACPAVSYSAVGAQPAASVACQVSQSHTAGGPSTPTYAILAVGNNAAETGISVNAATFGPLKVVGPIASNSSAAGSVVVSGGTLDMSGYTVDARGGCTGSITVAVPADNRCNSGGTFGDPVYPSQSLATLDLTAPNPAPVCTVGGGVLQFVPGYYTNAAALESPTYPASPACQPGSLYFQPGVYYFDFGIDQTYPDPVWNVTQRVVGGQYKGWNPNQAGSQPQQPNPGDTASVACKTEADNATDGVQFVFGGASQMNVTVSGATVELCPDPIPTGTNQQIAIYGQKTGAETVTTVTRAPATQNNPASWTSLPNVVSTGVPTINGLSARRAMAANTSTTLLLSGYSGSSAVPAGSINVSYTLNVAHEETSASAATNIGTLSAAITGVAGCVVPPMTKRNIPGSTPVVPVTDSLALTSAACIAAVQGAFGVTFTTSATGTAKTFTENLDGIDLVVKYTTPAVRAESGCTTVINGCAVVDVGGAAGQAKFVSWGTLYVPLGFVNADVNGASVVNFRRGVIARAVAVPHIPSGATLYYCLAAGSPCNAPPPPGNLPRVLLLTATVSGSVELRVLVQYVDTPALGTSLQVLSWNPVR